VTGVQTCALPISADEAVSVVGCLCTPLDRLGDKVALPPVKVGDLVAIFLAGAYGASASPAAFLGHPAPGEILVG
jgi:diaminopimelate decarboxylase